MTFDPAMLAQMLAQMPPALATALRDHAQATGQPLQAIVVAALSEYVGQPHTAKAPSHHTDRQRLAAVEQDLVAMQQRLAALEQAIAPAPDASRPVTLSPPPPPPATIASSVTLPPATAKPTAIPTAIPTAAASSGPSPADTPLSQCPKCHHKLGAPLKSSGRQVCGKCGWLSRSRYSATAEATPDAAADDLQQLLQQAAVESVNNMKPKNKQEPNAAPRHRPRFPF